MTNFKLKIASRRSKLAMVQTLWVKDQLEKNIRNLEVSIEAKALRKLRHPNRNGVLKEYIK